MGRRSGSADQKVISDVARAGMRRRSAAYKARQKGKPKSEKHREGNRRRNKRWKENNPEHVAALDRQKALRSYHKNHEANKLRQRLAKKKIWDAMSPDQRRDQHLRNCYKITLIEFKALLKRQKNRCACCRTDDPGSRGWMMDHCHKSGRNRGILCHHCNAGLGHAKDNPKTLRRWIAYLER